MPEYIEAKKLFVVDGGWRSMYLNVEAPMVHYRCRVEMLVYVLIWILFCNMIVSEMKYERI